MKYPAWVYVLRNETNGKAYVGISSNPKRRKSTHLSDLRCGRHPVEDMQADFTRCGGRFSFTILERVDERSQRSAEFRWQIKLRTLNRHTGYNYKDPVTNWYNRP
ncbi:MAG: GIY-YIG nuclease family protein [Clostridia bacterium]|nr:GIY-YIG nuclease family protein [Clostridia bacterium]